MSPNEVDGNRKPMRRRSVACHYLLSVIGLFSVVTSPALALPVSLGGYNVELYASGIGAADGMAFDANGDLFVTDYAGGRVLKVSGQNQVSVYASGMQFLTDLTFTDDHRLFAASSTGGSSDLLEIFGDGSHAVFASNIAYPNTLEYNDGYLYTVGGNEGVIYQIDLAGNRSTYLSGFNTPFGVMGISFDDNGAMYFSDHGTGVVYKYDNGILTTVGSTTALGATFTAPDNKGNVYVSDVNLGDVFKFDALGNKELFLEGLLAKSTPPVIGPTDLAFDAFGNLYVGDGDNIWKVTVASVPEPNVFALFAVGIFGIIVRKKRAAIPPALTVTSLSARL